jgi:hypothetical protein
MDPRTGKADRTAALQAEIRLAGRLTRWLRWLLRIGLVALAFVISRSAYLSVARALHHPDPSKPFVAVRMLARAWAPIQEFGAAGAFLFPVACTLVIASASAALYRMQRTAQLRRRLAALSPAERAAVLVPLEATARGDTRKIVAPLIQDFASPTEVTPVAAPLHTPTCDDLIAPATEGD